MNPKTITANFETLKRLKKAYEQAVAEGREQFVFDDCEMLTLYAKYLIEHITNLLKTPPHQNN
jgi:hypothetical protein